MYTATSHEHEPGTAQAVTQFVEEVEQSDGATLPIELLSDLDRAAARKLAESWRLVPNTLKASILRRMVEDSEEHVERTYGRVMHVALDDTDPEVRLIALDGIWEFDAPGLLKKLIALLSSEPDDRVRARVALALSPYVERAEVDELDGDQRDPLVQALLRAHHNDSSPEVRRRALEAVAFISLNPHVTRAIRSAYESDNHQLKTSALRAMGHQAMVEWLPTLYAELKSDEPELRFEAVTAIGMIMDERSSSLIVDMIADDDPEVSMAAIHALGSIGGPIAINTLRRIIRDEDDDVLIDAAQEALDEALLMENPLRPPF